MSRTGDLENKTKQNRVVSFSLCFLISTTQIYPSIYQVQPIDHSTTLLSAGRGTSPPASLCYLKPPFLGPGGLSTILWEPLQHGVVALTSDRPPNLKKFPSNLWHFLEGLTCLYKLALTFLTQISLNLISTFLVIPQRTCSGQYLFCSLLLGKKHRNGHSGLLPHFSFPKVQSHSSG